jgi:hypothetical protein
MKRILIIVATTAIVVIAVLLTLWSFHQLPHPTAQPSSSADAAKRMTQGPALDQPDQSQSPALLAASKASDSAARLIEELRGAHAHHQLKELRSKQALSPSERQALIAFLQEQTTDQKLERMASIKHTVMNVLARQPELPLPWQTILRQILEDESQHRVIRDYALQQLFSWHEATFLQGDSSSSEAERNAIEALFWRMLEQTQGSLAGTAILGLHNLSTKGGGIDRARLSTASLEIVRAPDSGPLTRISGLQVCALLGNREALAEAVHLAREGDSVALRASAIAAIGVLGSDAESALLAGLVEEANRSIRLASQSALARIETNRNRMQ